jgi:CHAT domain-containing protein
MLAGASYALEGGIIPEDYEDGLLTICEIEKLNLYKVDLAVISACKSALGEIGNNGVGGLTRAFKAAGVHSLVVTTDDVVDYVSGEVWKVFFRNIIEGKSKREALLDAIKHVRTIHDGFYCAPKFWTPFILIDGLD